MVAVPTTRPQPKPNGMQRSRGMQDWDHVGTWLD